MATEIHSMAAEEAAPAELLRAIARRDRRAFRRLYDAEAPRLYGVALRLLRDRATAADALQEAFVQIWQRADRYDPALGPARAWLTMIVRYRALDLARARGRERLEPESLAEDQPDPGPGALELLAVRERHGELARCLELLDGNKRDMILLAFVEGYSHSQIAARLDLPLGTVKAWIRRGLASLRDCLET